MPSKKPGRSKRIADTSRGNMQKRLYGAPPLASLGWLLGAAALAVAIGASGAYLVLGLIFYQNQAMMIFHPSRKITATPAGVGLAYQEVTFAPSIDGRPQLTGWWVPAPQDGPFRSDTILYLHGASGSLSNTVSRIKALQALGVNVFAIDYRGFGKSAKARPTEQSADGDALAAWSYLTAERKLPSKNLVVFGEGAGATFATHLAAKRTVAELVLAEISPTAHQVFEKDARARLLPLFLLAKEHINPEPELRHLKTPKLFLQWPEKFALGQGVTQHDYTVAAAPKEIASLPSATPAGVANAIASFLKNNLSAKH